MTLALLQAIWRVGMMRSDEAPEAAGQLLVSGVESPALVRLAGLVRPDYWEVAPLLDVAFREARLSVITEQEAHRVIALQTARDVVAGALTPREGARRLSVSAQELEYPDDLKYFVYLDGDYDPKDASWFDARIVETAERFLSAE